MNQPDELHRLEAERARLLSMINYQERALKVFFPDWIKLVLFGMGVGVVILIVTGLVAGEISFSWLLWSIVIIGLATYVLGRQLNVFGVRTTILEIISIATAWPPVGLAGSPVGDLETRKRLADCEAQITKLKAARS